MPPIWESFVVSLGRESIALELKLSFWFDPIFENPLLKEATMRVPEGSKNVATRRSYRENNLKSLRADDRDYLNYRRWVCVFLFFFTYLFFPRLKSATSLLMRREKNLVEKCLFCPSSVYIRKRGTGGCWHLEITSSIRRHRSRAQ